MVTMYIQYAKNEENQLVITCYHEKVQSITSAILKTQEFGIPRAALQKREEPFSDPTPDDVKARLLEVLQEVKNNSGPIREVYFSGDLNLCCKQRAEPAPFLFDKTINNFFSDARYVHLTLESLNHEYVHNAIALADACGLTDLTIQTKKCIVNNPVSKSYPSSVKESTVGFFKKERKDSQYSYEPASCCTFL